jgi:lysophospholipid acyltransferase (LPLAT)-like uncharacterized protein
MADLGLWWRKFQGNAMFAYFRVVSRTTRWQFEGRENVQLARETGRPLLWAFWHGQTMAFLHYADRFEDPSDFAVILVGDKRFDILNVLGDRLGAAATHAVDMRGNPMAGGRAVLRVISALKEGRQTILAPDGPDGPPFTAKAGVSFLARKAAAAVLPVGIWTRQAVQLRRWDRYLVALPFARMVAVFGQPILADRRSDDQTLREQISEAMTKVRYRAQQLAGDTRWP